MMGVIFAIIAGAAMSFQGVMNTRLSEKIGLYESNMFVQGTAFVLSLIVMWLFGTGDLRGISDINKIYLLGGGVGLIITVTVMLAIGNLSPTVAISIILISQLTAAVLIDIFGLLGTEKKMPDWSQYIGIGLMISGVLLVKSK